MSSKFQITFDSPRYDPSSEVLMQSRYLANVEIQLGNDHLYMHDVFFAAFAKGLIDTTLGINFEDATARRGLLVHALVPGISLGILHITMRGTKVRVRFDNIDEFGRRRDIKFLQARNVELIVFNRSVASFYEGFIDFIERNNDGDDGLDQIFLSLNCFSFYPD